MSTTISPDLIKLVLKKSNWGNYTAINQFQIWELREALSYTLELDYFIDEDQNPGIIKVITAITNKEIDYTWDKLTLLQEAKIQSELRTRGLEIKCFELNEFPTSIKDFDPIININWRIALKFKIYKSIRFIDEYKYFLFLYMIIGYNVIFFNFQFLLSSLIFSYTLHFLLQIIEHDYIMHEYIVPKNKVIEYIVTYVARISLGNYEQVKASHMNHHYFWNQSQDYHTILIRQSKIKSLLDANIYALAKYQTLVDKILEKGLIKLNKMNFLHRFLNDNYFLTISIIGAIMLSCFGIAGFVGFFLTPMVYHIVFGSAPDVTMNMPNKQKNLPWLWPLLLRDAWHYQHHIKYTPNEFKKIEDIFFGPKILMYLNFEYYLIKLFFKIPDKRI